MEFKGQKFEKKVLHIREEARLANLAGKLKDPDMEIKADAMINMTLIETDLKLEFLEGLSMVEFTELLGIIRPKVQPAEAPAPEQSAETPSTSETQGN